jgi:hypothetical protein
MVKYLFILVFALGLLISGCGIPNDPESILGGDGGYKIVGKYKTSAYAQDVVIKDTLVYIAQGEGGLEIISAANPSIPKLIINLTEGCRGYSSKIALLDTIIYIASGTFGITVVDVSDPYQPYVTVNNRSIRPGKDFYIFKNFLFTAISEEGVNIAEISYPAQPDPRGTLITPGYAQGVACSSDSNFALVAIGEMGLAFYDISQLQTGWGNYPLIKLVDTDGYAENVCINPDMPIAYVASGTGGLAIIDYSDSTNIRLAGKFDTGGYAKEVFYKSGKVFITTELRGLQIIDVSNPSSPSRIGTVQTAYAKGVTADDHYIYIADEQEGLVIVSIP